MNALLRRFAALLSCCLFLASAAHAQSGVIFDTGSPTHLSGAIIGSDEDQQLFGAFMATSDTITGLQGYFRQTTYARYKASLYADDNGLPDFDHPLTSVVFDAPIDPTLDNSAYATPIGGAVHQSVTVGKLYWIGFSFVSGDYGAATISDRVTNPAIAYAFGGFNKDDQGNYTSARHLYPMHNTEFGFRVLGNPVPEPGSWSLMLLGFGATGAALRRRPSRSATRATAA